MPSLPEIREEAQKYVASFDKVIVHQFDFALIYLPFYLALKKIVGETKLVFETPTGNDKDCVNNITDGPETSLAGQEKELRLGVSEITDHNDEVHHVPFISRLPLWGVTMANNETVVDRISHLAAHNVFGSKLSKLQTKDLDGLRLGTYSAGSTAYKLLKGLRQGKTTIRSFKNEEEAFKMLNAFKTSSGIDLFITIQPWLILQYAQEVNEQLEIMIVYNHPTPLGEYTSIYVKKLNTHEDKILDVFMKYLGILVWHEAAELYKSREGYLDKIRNLCEMKTYDKSVKDFCKNPSRNTTSFDLPGCKWCDSIKPFAIEVISDSRIFYTHPDHNKYLSDCHANRSLSEFIIEWEEDNFQDNATYSEKVDTSTLHTTLDKYYPYSWKNNINNIKTNTDEQSKKINNDQIFWLAEFLNCRAYKARHLETHLQEDHSAQIKTFLLNMGLSDTEINRVLMDTLVYERQTSSSPDINNDWRISRSENKIYDKFFPFLKDKLAEGGVASMFNPIITGTDEDHPETSVLQEAFFYLNSDLSRNTWCKFKSAECCVINNGNERLNCLFIKYKPEGEAVGAPPGKFATENIIGKKVLNGYWISRDNFEHVFVRPLHGKLHKEIVNEKIKLRISYGLASPDQEFYLSLDEEAWLFTFMTYI